MFDVVNVLNFLYLGDENHIDKVVCFHFVKPTAHWVSKPVDSDKYCGWVSTIMELVLLQRINPVLPIKRNITQVPAPPKWN